MASKQEVPSPAPDSDPWGPSLKKGAAPESTDCTRSSVYSSPETYKKAGKSKPVGSSEGAEKRHIAHVTQIKAVQWPKMKKLTRWQKLKRHWARFWFCYLLACVVFLAIFLPLL